MILLSVNLFLLLLVLILIVQVQHTINPRPKLIFKPKLIDRKDLDNQSKLSLELNISNPLENKEIMIPSFTLQHKILSNVDMKKISVNIDLKTNYPDQTNRLDNYWQSYILKSKSTVTLLLSIDITDTSYQRSLSKIDALWIDAIWSNYDSSGLLNRKDGFVIPFDIQTEKNTQQIQSNNNLQLIPVKTHLLGVLDDPITTIVDYIKPQLRKGDIITIGETPLAIMQGRYIHPSSIVCSNLSQLLSKFFHPTSSLATACGMQVLINEIGPLRSLFAFILGAFMKTIKIKGFFYRIAGTQARLIDDITGTTPPYDQTIVLGPTNTKSFCDEVSNIIGSPVAIVDVNDLGRVKILESSDVTLNKIISKSLVTNPAGNADQRTPIVIIRP